MPENGRFVNRPYRIPNKRNPFTLPSFEIEIAIEIEIVFPRL
jgi:phenylalanyl-tRNA synthetase alpha subunit